MHITLTWDLLVIVFFALVVAYSFIVGKDESMKIIIASYIAIVAVQGLGNILSTALGGSLTLLGMFGLPADAHMVSVAKVFLFVIVIIFLSLRGGFDITCNKDIGGVWDPFLTAAFGFSTAGLLLSTLLTFIAARPILDATLGTAAPLLPLLAESRLIQVMVNYQDLWFAAPAFLLLLLGFLKAGEEE